MTVSYWIMGIVMFSVLGWGLLLGFTDALLRRRHHDLLAMREWDETVQAMRRMADREGDA